MPVKPNDLPRSPAEWEKAQRGLKAENIHTLGQLDSASEIQKPQFLLLRALWHSKPQNEFKTKDWLEEAYIEDAVSFLDDYSDWKIYLESFSQKIKLEQRPFPSLGAFTLVKYSQLEVETTEAENSSANAVVSAVKTRSMTVAENATPSKAPPNRSKFLNAEHEGGGGGGGGDDDDDDDDDRDSFQNVNDESYLSPWSAAKKSEQKVLYPPTEDEQIVNAALLSFLTAVTIAHPRVCLRWCLARKVLQFVCNAENGRASKYQARTDGYLRGANRSTAYGIVEVKPYIRAHVPNTRWQETAQMAAWIWQDPLPQSIKFQ
jgi:hypothetical protein